MADDHLWVIHIGNDGREVARTPLPCPAARDSLPLRQIVTDGLRLGSVAIAIARRAANAACRPTTEESEAVEAAIRTLNAVGLRLHDYILWHGDRCVSLRLTGRL